MFWPWVCCHESRSDGFIYLGEEFGNGTDTNLLLAIFCTPDREWCTPVATTAKVPVIEVLQPFTEASCTRGLWLPIDGFIECYHLFACLCRADEPRV